MDTPTSYFGTEAFARFKQMNEDVFRVEAQAKALGMEDARLALYRARIELGHEESRYRAQYAKDAPASLVQGTEATAGGGANYPTPEKNPTPAYRPAGVEASDSARGLSGEAWSAVTKQCFDCDKACADVRPGRCTLCPNKKAAAGVMAVDPAQPCGHEPKEVTCPKCELPALRSCGKHCPIPAHPATCGVMEVDRG
jgi:hypothetical protein